jgi:hypothetical protein
MKNRPNIIFSILKFAFLVVLMMSVNGMVRAQASLKTMGEIAAANQATINGLSVISGMTVFSNNRIRTAGQGAAIVNLGKIGRIEFGPQTDMTLSFSPTSIGGELHSNSVVVSAPAGVAISIKTPEGMVTTDGKKPAVLTVYAGNKNARVMTHISEAIVTSGGSEGLIKINHVAAGEELSQANAAAVAGTTRLADRIASPAAATGPSNSSTFTGLLASTFTGLFNSGVAYSLPSKSESSSNYDESFETSITCRNNDKKYCRKKSVFKP